MVIGNGMLAKAFSKYKHNNGILIFASGVSNSKSNDISDFKREIILLKKIFEDNIHKKHFIYFSTCSIYDPEFKDSMYVKHKLYLENYISKNLNNYTIFRLSNVIGNTKNINTIFQFLKFKIENEETFDLWINAERNFIDIDQLVEILDLFLGNIVPWNKKIINIANYENTKILQLESILEEKLKKKSLSNHIFKGGSIGIDTSILRSFLKLSNPNFKFHSIDSLIEKYII